MNSHEYENNPFMVTLNGMKLLFEKAQSIAIYAIILCVIVFIPSVISNTVGFISSPDNAATDASNNPPYTNEQIIIGCLIIALILVLLSIVGTLLSGVLHYTSAKLSRNESASLGEAFKAVLSDLGPYVWLNILIWIRVLLWSLLFIIPGIIMSIRYSLANTVYFAEGKRGNAAIRRSAEITKGAWLTTYASPNIWNLMTGGIAAPLITPSANAILYRQLSALTDSNQKKPSAHWLSWLTLIVPIVAYVLVIVFIFAAIGLLLSTQTAP